VTTYTAKETREHTERLRAMVEDDGETWDLSDNDKAALRMALEAVELANSAICNYCGHVGPKERDAMVDHTLSCDKRPEVKLLNYIDTLRAFARHEPMCKAYRYPGLGKCDCGYAVMEQEFRGVTP
jgi:hypothetical protein